MNKELVKKSIEVFGDEAQKIVAIEELSELQKELCKSFRNNDKYKAQMNRENIIEEMADVYIVLENIKQIFKIRESEIKEMIDAKQFRLGKRIDEICNSRNS